MMELLKMSNLEFITEYPNFAYTKAMSKYETWIGDMASLLQLETPEEIDEYIGTIDRMSVAFMKKNVSHKRRRSHELVNALKGEEANANVLDHEGKGFRRFLGLK